MRRIWISKAGPPEVLLAQLDDVDAAAERRPQQRFGIGAVRPRVADEVEARGSQPLPQQRPVALGGRKAHHSIMAGGRAEVASEAEREPYQARAERVTSRSPTV